MHQHTWYQKLKALNPSLKVCQFENSKHLPSLYYVHERDGVIDICAVDKTWVPVLPVYDKDGALIKSGSRRVIFNLLAAKLTTPEKVKKIFPSFFEQNIPRPSRAQTASLHQYWSEMMKHERARLNILGEAQQVDVQDKTMDKMKQMEIENFNRRGTAALSGDQFVELADDLDKHATPDKQRALDEAKFNYDKAVGKRKSII